ncbi:putative C2 protein [Venustampulla echinocandica]|uniref:Putative C2 protein n=1 Tax=Venustampulla echinocandica TaxID=2656787 RepID=A0A370TMK4_9HELO|nr:putative C2 protein [Venustampulla echinocandica]RDL36747.1 putative C2 protein [Venustampulla echinocandica]
MSTASTRSRGNRRVDSLQNSQRRSISRTISRTRPKPPSYNDGYTFALRVAYLHHLLQPRAKRKQYVAAPKPIQQRRTVMIGELIQDFSRVKDTKSAKFPHGFMSPLEKRLQGVVTGTERLPGYNDAGVKRTFAEAYTAFTEQGFRRRMDKERRVEDLVLIFYSNATKALQKTQKGPDDDSWKILVDRHVALFVRLIGNTLKDLGNDKDRPELMSRLTTLEKKLLTNDQDLFINTTGKGAETTIEVVVPISLDVKDMVMVQTVGKIFGLRNSQMQSDIDANRKLWTEEAALMDLKAYQHCLDSNTKRTLRNDDFDLDEGYQTWKKAEIPELSQMIAEILKAKPELVKSSTDSHNKPLPSITPTSHSAEDQAYSELAKSISNPTDSNSLYSFDQPADMSALSLETENPDRIYLEQSTYTFIPPEPRAYYRTILSTAMTFEQLHAPQSDDASVANAPLSRQSLELIAELCLRWRIPQFTKLVLFLDVAAQKFLDQEIGLDELDAAFEFVKNPPAETKRPHAQFHSLGLLEIDQRNWTVQDYALHRQILLNLHDGLLRDLYDLLQHCYDPKPPSPGPVLTILESHLYNDPSFSQDDAQVESYQSQLTEGLRSKAAEVYRSYLEAEVPQDQEEWEFFHVVQLGKAVVKLCERIQKRYRKNPDIMGVNPLTILVETMFPSFENDANDLIQRILHVAQTKDSEVDVQDGFDLYKELVEIRRIHHAALPEQPFAFHIESCLADFVRRWIRRTDEKICDLIDQMIKQDEFKVRSDDPNHPATDDERHSSSVIDMFRLYNQTSDQIFKLEWDDDVQYAQFMTSLSKSFGVGLARYCEIIDQMFNKEMDRLSPAQEAAASQTKQEKWVQLAKDAWNNKEKIEPFQFYPESFVKLNNLEYAIRQLDNLEKTMNVDACAEVLTRVAPPKEKKRRPSKYVFTIKIVEAEDLKACDPNGTSDPYVVLGDEYQKRLAKTRIVMRNLNPRWDESVDITVSGPLVIIATIWDWDTFGDHDYVGRTNLKLDPTHFMDYMPREYWLDLDTQGRLLLRVSMEGERDDIQFYFGKAFRLAKRTERDMTRVITDKLSQYINSSLSQDALKYLISGGGISVASVTMLWKSRQSVVPSITPLDIETALKPLLAYFDENFAIMKQTLTDASMVMVMTRLWKEVLLAIEGLLVPPLSDKPSAQKPLTQQEMDIVFKWLEILFNFFHSRDEETGEVLGVPADVLKSPKYHELASLNFFYFDTTDNLIRTSERMATATAQRAQAQRNRLSAPATLGASFGGLMGSASVRRAKSIMMSRNLGTMKKAKEEKRKEAQADPSDDMILRILRMRLEAATYLRDRSRQKSRLAAAAAAEMVVRQSLAQGSRFGANNLPRR